MQRRFGPVQAAGVAVEERDAGRPIQPGARGIVAYTGTAERGPVGKLEYCADAKSFRRKFGGKYPGGQLPDAALDFFEHSLGAGGVWVLRATDGTETKASVVLKTRHASPVPAVRVTAKSGGAWGGRRLAVHGKYTLAGDLTNTVLTTGVSVFKGNQLKGGVLTLAAAPTKRYNIISNTAEGVITVAADSKMLTDSGAQEDKGYLIEVASADDWGQDRYLAVAVVDGAEEPAAEWGLHVFVNGERVKRWDNLSSDPNSPRYFVTVVTGDGDNPFVDVEDLYTGDKTAAEVRPANHAGVIPASGVTKTKLTLPAPSAAVTTGDANGTVGSYVYGTDLRAQKVTLTFTSPTAFDVASSIHKGAALPAGTVGTAYEKQFEQSIGFTVTAGSTAFETGDVVEIDIPAFPAGELVGGYVYPNTGNEPKAKYRIVSNTAREITVAPGSDMLVVAAAGDHFRVEWPQQAEGGYDGGAVPASKYEELFSISTSAWKNLAGKGQGLVKFALPGVTETAAQQAAVAFCEANNYQFRYEIPSDKVDETVVEEYVSETLGRNDFVVVSFPSYAQVRDPRPGGSAPVLRTLTGKIHGVEALFARAYEGYHRAAAGTEAKLKGLIDLPVGLDLGHVIDEEKLNPRGINVVKRVGGSWVLWGDRTCFLNSGWKWKHQRELMSAYEHDLLENFDWIVFRNNDPETAKEAISSLTEYFEGEHRKGALKGATADAAFSVQIDEGNNSAADADAGDLNADISLALTDTVERFVISIGKDGLSESAA